MTEHHEHTTAVAAMEWRELLTCLERGCDEWPTRTITTALFFAVAGMESELRDRRARDGVDGARLARALGRLIRLAPANGKRKTVPAADVQAIWQELRS